MKLKRQIEGGEPKICGDKKYESTTHYCLEKDNSVGEKSGVSISCYFNFQCLSDNCIKRTTIAKRPTCQPKGATTQQI